MPANMRTLACGGHPSSFTLPSIGVNLAVLLPNPSD